MKIIAGDIQGYKINDSMKFIKGKKSPRLYPFYVENITDNVETLLIKQNGRGTIPSLVIEYSTDAENWFTLGTTSTTGITRTLQPSERLYLRCTTTSWAYNWDGYNSIIGVSKVGGNVMSLIYGSSFTGDETILPQTSYNGCHFDSLLKGSTNLLDASELILPVTDVSSFVNGHIYAHMFQNCRNLVTAPDLTVDVVGKNLYDQMFSGCTSLKYIKCLVTYTGSNYTFTYWVNGVPSGGTFVKKAGITWPTGQDGIPEGWTVVEV